ncbi:MAG TPA: ankyrin repeat domain-containing protein, partial [Spongiibacteraceae bacterium]|nr:ankyrin repeat domain-containing protein [Spongiibacteraceae bacterium]
QGDIKVATLLLQAGADSNHLAADQKSPLWYAVERNDAAMIDILLQHDAQPNQAPARADIIAFAAKGADEKIVLALLKRARDIETPFADATPLQWCAQRGFSRAMQQLIAQHAQIDRRDGTGRSALWLAAANNKADAVELLLREHATLDLADREEVTPLAIAATRGNTTVVDLLIRNGAAVDKASREGNTPLLLAARSAHTDTIKRLLAAKADFEHRNERSETALMLAATSGCNTCIAALFDAGVDAARRDRDRRTAVDYARRHHFDELAQRLQDHIDKKVKFAP